MNQAKTKTYQKEDIETLKQFMAQMTIDELVSFITEVCRIADEEKKPGTHFQNPKTQTGVNFTK